MLIAITRAVSPAINRCELGFIERQEISLAKAGEQHRLYEACLAELGAAVVSLPAEPDYPDSVFVEDPAVVVDEVAVITRMGAASRRGESESLGRALARYRPLRHLREPATLEGGDVMRIGRTLFVGVSHRSNRAGVGQLSAELAPFGYTVVPVEVRGALHLKTACCHIGDGNVLAAGDSVIAPLGFPRTAEILAGIGKKVRLIDVSELMKAEAGVTCSSLLFHY
jgi:dimethylargininase